MIIRLIKYCWTTPCQASWKWWRSCIINILIAIIIIILFCLLVTSTCKSLFKCTGQIGDTIGGITAPILGLVNIVLLYITFRGQGQFNEEQSEFNNYTLLTNLQEKILDKLDNLTLTYDSHTYTGFDEIYTNKDNLSKINEQELIKFKSKLIYCHRLIRIFLLTNKEATLKQRIRVTLYKAIKDIATEMTEIYSVLEECHQIQEPSSWTNLKTELNKYLKECNPEDKK